MKAIDEAAKEETARWNKNEITYTIKAENQYSEFAISDKKICTPSFILAGIIFAFFSSVILINVSLNSLIYLYLLNIL